MVELNICELSIGEKYFESVDRDLCAANIKETIQMYIL